MQAHANDLRAEVKNEWDTLSATLLPDDAGLDNFVHQIVDDWRESPVSNAVRALAEFAEKVTHSPAACTETDISALRAAGWCDTSIHDAVQVVAYFNYINRVADALGVEAEKGLPHWGRR
ncbi:MAG: hypothetical protein ACE5I3_01195 [Phycisphaerae bacterium]